MSRTDRPAHLTLAHLVRARREALGLTAADVQAAGGPSFNGLAAIEKATHVATAPRPATLASLDRVLQWPDGTAAAVHAGTTTWAPVSLRPTFRQWLRLHLGEDTKFGDIAPEIVDDPEWPDDIETADDMAAYLDTLGLGVALSFVDATLAAFLAYRAEHPSGGAAQRDEGNGTSPSDVPSGNDEVTEAVM